LPTGHHAAIESLTQEPATGPTIERIESATNAMRKREVDLMSRAGVFGVGVGSDDNSTDATIVVYIDVNYAGTERLPRRIDGFRVKRIYTEPIVAY